MNMKCEYNEFLDLSQNIDTLNDYLSEQTTDSKILGARYSVDIQTFTKTWQTCIKQIESSYLIEISQEYTFFDTVSCPSSYISSNEQESEKDPCCNSSLSWNTCCVPRTITLKEKKLQISSSQLDDNYCDSSDCLETLLQDYILYREIGRSLSGCSAAIKSTLDYKQYQSLSNYRSCKETIFGDVDGYGMKCKTDDDCILSSQCHLHFNICIYDQNNLNLLYGLFFECLSSTVRLDIKEYLMNLNGENNFISMLWDNYLIIDCVSFYGRSLKSSGYTSQPWIYDLCGMCDYYCFDDSCVPPLRCEEPVRYGRPDSACFYSKLGSVSSNYKCSSDYLCNWNQSISNEDDCIESSSISSRLSEENISIIKHTQNETHIDKVSQDFFCGVCETPDYCIIVLRLRVKKNAF